MTYYFDNQRHLVCIPYSVENLHKMAKSLGIKRCWFHKDHYDIPLYKLIEVSQVAQQVRPRDIFFIIKFGYMKKIP